ncbi:hypothetical protein HID58_079803 [Brassica napus]|uniref:Uncharacterized protein n=1 Tax=Brassica napus TaxID=3708 RepID=A0ABQ7Y324_BRANA|nr:hypothetical protein HID58_079803 [Brassica napus]
MTHELFARNKRRGKDLHQMLQRSNASQLTRREIWRRSMGSFNTHSVVLFPKKKFTRGTSARGNKTY